MAATTTAHVTARPGAPAALLDLALAAAALAGTVALLHHGGVAPTTPAASGLYPAGFALASLSTLPLVFWRRSPIGVFLVTATGGVLLAGLGYPADLLLGPTVAVYLLAASRDDESPWSGRTTATVIGLFGAYLAGAALAQDSAPVFPSVHTGLAWSVAWFAGERTRLRREQLAELSDRVAHAAREAERDRQLAVAEERTRVARDLHDSVGHAISVIAVRAGAARLRQDPERALVALQAIEELARRTAGEIDHLVGTLRGGPADGMVEAPPGLASLDMLIGHHREAGLAVTVARTGEPRSLGGASDQAAYRIIQQALSNAARHGSGGAHIALEYADAALALTVINPVESGASVRPGGGHGVIGMRERATLLGGTLDAGRVDDTFRVRACIPYGEGSP